LGAGTIPPRLDDTIADVLAAADRTAGDERVEWLVLATSLAFHRTVHLDEVESPIVKDPGAALAPLLASVAWRELIAPAGRTQSPTAKRPRHGRPRLLVVHDGDLRFLEPLLHRLRESNIVELRLLDLPAWAEASGLAAPLRLVDQVRARANPRVAESPWAKALEAELSWADTVWVEWCQRSAALVTMVDPGARRTIVRLHSFEAFTVFPHLVDPSRIDEFVTVSVPLQRLCAAVVPSLAGPGRTTAVVPPLLPVVVPDPSTRQPDALTLAVVGWGAPAKDLPWAIDLLVHLRRTDPRWRLLLVGATPTAPGYAARIEAARSAVPDAIDELGWTDDVAGALAGVDVIVSSSTRESFHLGLAEGVAAGALPVVRDWPTLQPFGGAAAVWPTDWVVGDVPAAADRIAAWISSGRPRPAEPAARQQFAERNDLAWETFAELITG